MYWKVRHGIVEPIRIRPILRLMLLALGVLLILATIVLLILWRKAVLAHPAVTPITALCNFNLPVDLPPSVHLQCGPSAAEIAPPSAYARAVLVTSAAGAGCLIGTYMLGRRSPTR